MAGTFSIVETREGWILLELSSRAVAILLRLAAALSPPEGDEARSRLAPLEEADSPPLSRARLGEALGELVRLLEHHGAAWEASGALTPGPSAETLRRTIAAALAELGNHAEDAEFEVRWID
jgi:hypothetical protein